MKGTTIFPSFLAFLRISQRKKALRSVEKQQYAFLALYSLHQN